MTQMERTRIIFYIIIGITVLAIIIGLIIDVDPPLPTPLPTSISSNGTSNRVATSIPGPTPTRDPRGVTIVIWTNDTKATWVNTATEMFNQRGFTLEDGRQIWVDVEQHDSGDFPVKIKALKDKTQTGPTIISPGTIAWVNAADDIWRDYKGQPLVSGDCPSLAYAPIGFGMWQSMADAMGWPDTPIGWEEIASLAADPEGWAIYGHPEWGQFKWGHTDPNSSNTGLTAMTSFVYATLGITEGLIPSMVRSPEVINAFEHLELNTYHYGRSTRSLNIATALRGKAYLHATASSENSILATNVFQKEFLEEPIVFIFPKEGAFWSENPFCVVNAPWVSDAHQEAAEIYKDFLLSREAQLRTVEGWLRPVDQANFPEQLPEEWQYTDHTVTIEDVPPLETDTSGETATAIQDVFNRAKKRAVIIVVLDRSQSMEGKKLKAAVEAINEFLLELDREDEVQVLMFGDDVISLNDLSPAGTVVETLTRQLSGIWAEGNTTLYDAICQAKETAEMAKAEDETAREQRLYGVVLLSDGRDTNSQRSEDEMFTTCVPRTESADVVKIFTIAYGSEADGALLERIANRTNGKDYVADEKSIIEVLREIQWEQ